MVSYEEIASFTNILYIERKLRYNKNGFFANQTAGFVSPNQWNDGVLQMFDIESFCFVYDMSRKFIKHKQPLHFKQVIASP